MNSRFQNVLAVTSVVIFFTNWPDYAHVRLGILVPNQWVFGLGLLAVPSMTRQIMGSDILRSPVVIWCFGYAWVTMLWFLGSSQSDVAWQVVRWRFLSIIEMFLFLAIFTNQEANKTARQALVIAVLAGVLIQVYELFFPMSFSEVLGRSAGLYMNPNAAGTALVTGMICAVTVLPLRYRVGFIVLTGIGVMASISRGSILAWGASVVGLVAIGRVRLKDIVVTGFLGLVVVIFMLIPQWNEFVSTLEKTGSINKNVEERLAWLTDPSGVSDQSSWARMYVAKRSWDMIEEKPIWGSGTGSSFEAELAPHNQSLAFMQDHGVLGVLILPLLLLAVILSSTGEHRRTAVLFSGSVMLLSFFSHDLLSQSHTLLLLALAATMFKEKSSPASESARGVRHTRVGTSPLSELV